MILVRCGTCGLMISNCDICRKRIDRRGYSHAIAYDGCVFHCCSHKCAWKISMIEMERGHSLFRWIEGEDSKYMEFSS